MKKLLALGILASLTLSALGQGQLNFQNRVTTSTPAVDAKIYIDVIGGTTPSGTDTTFRAALLGGAAGSVASSIAGIGNLTMLASPSTSATWVNFRTGAAAGYLPTTDTARNSGLAYGATGVFQVVAWQGNYTTWAAAYAAGMAGQAKIGWSNPVTSAVTQNALDLAVPNLLGLNSFAVAIVPEPTSMALMGLGAAALLIFRRRK